MHELVFSQTATFSKPLVTLRTLEFLSRMSLQMTFHVRVIRETLLTPKARVRPLSSVNPHVNVKVSFNCETLSTLSAAERLLSSVNS